ncbi:MAG TPA: hypothetical protein VGR10_02695, partial [Thermoleophilaceae bacterium]|nr:hypothetical protein [Thermoleophilaceae bacterium]
MSVEAPERQLEWEARAGRLAAVAAFVGGLLPFVGAVVFRASLGEVGAGTVDFLTAVDGAPGGVLAGAALGAIGTLAVPVALAYLHRATRARRPESAGFVLPLLAVAAVGVAAVLAVEQIALLDVAGQVAELEEPTEEEADGLVEDSSLSQIATVSFVFRVAFGASLLM